MAMSGPLVVSLATATCATPVYSLVQGPFRLPSFAYTTPAVVSTAISGPFVASLATATCATPAYSFVQGPDSPSFAYATPVAASTPTTEGADAVFATASPPGIMTAIAMPKAHM